MKGIAIYPGTFDPLTLGHEDLVKRAANLFDGVIVAVTDNPEKTSWFSLEERVSLAKQVFADDERIQVEGFSGLLVDFAKEKNANIILRGLRVVTDFDYEFQLAGINRRLAPEMETLFLMPADRYEYVSSSVVRTVAKGKGDVSKFVPTIVAKALAKK